MSESMFEEGIPPPVLVSALDRVIDEQPLHGVLSFLNARTTHRYTAICATSAQPQTLAAFDRENPQFQFGASDAPGTLASVCAGLSPPADAGLRAAATAELHTRDGRTWGVLAHADRRPWVFPERELPFFRYAAHRLEGALVHRTEELPARTIPPAYVFASRTPEPLARALDAYGDAYLRHYTATARVQRARAMHDAAMVLRERVRMETETARTASAAARAERARVRAAVEQYAVMLRRQAAPPQHMVIAVRTMIRRQLRQVADPTSIPLVDDLWSQALRWGLDAYYSA